MFLEKARLQPLTTCVALACAAIFFGINMLGRGAPPEQLAIFGYFPPSAVWSGKPWALITSVFVHFEPWHMLFNVYWMWLLGGAIERDIGSWKWALLFVSAAWVSSAAQLASGNSGIGLSGVGYALFGFAWVGRDKLRHAGPIANEGTVNLFLVWLVGCIAVTMAGWANIGNEAHFGGLVFGAAVAGAAFKKRFLLAPVVALLLAASLTPLFYNPRSDTWTFVQAYRAHEAKDYETAKYWYRRTLALGGQESSTWHNLALIAAQQGDRKAFEEAMKKLRLHDNKAATELEGLEHAFGASSRKSSSQ